MGIFTLAEMVVGAGFAGCTASKVLSETGYNVFLIEKFKMPMYKSCLGVLIKNPMEFVKTHFKEDVLESAICTPTNNRSMIFTNDKGKEYHFEQEEKKGLWLGSFLSSCKVVQVKSKGLKYGERVALKARKGYQI